MFILIVNVDIKNCSKNSKSIRLNLQGYKMTTEKYLTKTHILYVLQLYNMEVIKSWQFKKM